MCDEKNCEQGGISVAVVMVMVMPYGSNQITESIQTEQHIKQDYELKRK